MAFYIGGVVNVSVLDESGDLERGFTLTPGALQINGATLEGANLWLAISSVSPQRILRVASNTADGTSINIDTQHRINLSGINTISAVAINGNDIYFIDETSGTDSVYLIAANTPDNTTATIVKRIRLPASIADPLGLAISGSDLVIGDVTNNNIQFIPINTPHNTTATVSKTINMPSEITNINGLAIDGNNLYVPDLITRTIHRIDADTANNTTAVIRETITIDSSVTHFINALAFSPNQANFTITVPTNVYEGQTRDITITSDIAITNFLLTDITVTGATANSLSVSGTNTWRLNVTVSTGSTSVTVSIAEDVVNPGNVAVSRNFPVNPRPTVTMAFNDANVVGGEDTDATVTFSEPVTGLAVSDFTASAGSIALSGSGSSYTVTVTAPSIGDGTITLTLAADSVDQGNLAVSDTIDYAQAIIPVTFTITFDRDAAEAGDTIEATLTASDAVNDLTVADLTDSGGTFANFSGSGTTYTVDWTLPTGNADGTATLTIAEDAVSQGNTETSESFDYLAPLSRAEQLFYHESTDTESIRVVDKDTANNADAAVRLIFDLPSTSTDVRSIAIDDTHVYAVDNNGSQVHVFDKDSAYGETATRRRNFDLPTSGTDNISNPRGALIVGDDLWVLDRDNGFFLLNKNTADGTTATVVRSFGYPTGINNGQGLVLVGHNLVFISDSASQRSVFFVAESTADGTTEADLIKRFDLPDVNGGDFRPRALAYADGYFYVFNNNDEAYILDAETTADTTASVERQFSVPSPTGVQGFAIFTEVPDDQITATISTDETDLRVNEVFDVDIVFSEVVTGFIASDITVTGGTRGALSGSGTDYTLSVTAPSSAGAVTVSIAADVVPEGNRSASEDFTVLALPTATVVFSPTSLRRGRTATATITWSESVSGFAIGDLSVDVGNVSNFSGTGTTYTADVTAPTTGTGDLTLTIDANAVSVGNAEADYTIAYSALPTVTITSDDSDIETNEAFTVTFQWSETVTGFATGGVSVTGATKGDFSAVDGDTYTLDLTADSSAGDIVVTVAEDAVTVGNAEASETYTSVALPTATVVFSPATLMLSGTATATITWSEAVTGFAFSDLSVDVGSIANFATVSTTVYTVEVTAPDTGFGNITLTIDANAVSDGNSEVDYTIAYSVDPNALSIEAIDEQFITVGTKNYVLTIDIGGNPDSVEPSGDFEEFYHDWDSTNNQVHIKSDEVKRLVEGATWTITLTKGVDTLEATITYNVVNAVPIFTDPGAQTLYKGVPFNLMINASNSPSVIRGGGLLTGLGYTPAEGGVLTDGILPRDATLTEDTFDAEYYAEGGGGSDTLTVPITIEELPNYIGAFRNNQLRIYDVDDSNAQVGSNISLPATENWTDIALWGELVAVVSRNGVIKVFDTSNNNAQVGSDIDFSESTNDSLAKVALSGQYVAGLSNLNRILAVYDTGNSNMQVGSNIDVGETSSWDDMAMSDNLIAVLHRTVGAKIFDIDADGAQVGNDITLNNFGRIAISKNIVVASSQDTLKVFDTSNGNAQVGSDIELDSSFNNYEISISGNLIIALGDANDVIKIFDVNNNLAPVGDDISLGTGDWDFISISGNFVAALNNTTNVIKIWDVSDNNAQVGNDIALGTASWRGIAMTGF